MSDAKDYLNFQETSSSIRSVLEQLSNISSITFADNSSDLESALEVENLLENMLIQFFLEKDLQNTSIPHFYEELCKNIDMKIEESRPNQYYGGTLEDLLELLNNGTHETLSTVINKDWVYGIYSDYSLIKAAITAWYRLKRAILLSLK